MRNCLPTTILAGGGRGILLFTYFSDKILLYVVQAGSHLMNPKCWDCKHVTPYLATLAPFQTQYTANMTIFYVSLSCLTPMRRAGGNAVPPLGPLPQAVINLWVDPALYFSLYCSATILAPASIVCQLVHRDPTVPALGTETSCLKGTPGVGWSDEIHAEGQESL